MTSLLKHDAVISGNWTHTGTFTPPDYSIKNQHFSATVTEALSYLKQHTTFGLWYGQPNASSVAAATQVIYACPYPAKLLSALLRIVTAPTGGDLAYTVDVQSAASGSSSWTSLFSSVITVNSSDTDDSIETATLISDPSLAANDSLRVVVAVSGSTGTQGLGFGLALRLAESPSATALV
jgi:hypothetical protein